MRITSRGGPLDATRPRRSVHGVGRCLARRSRVDDPWCQGGGRRLRRGRSRSSRPALTELVVDGGRARRKLRRHRCPPALTRHLERLVLPLARAERTAMFVGPSRRGRRRRRLLQELLPGSPTRSAAPPPAPGVRSSTGFDAGEGYGTALLTRLPVADGAATSCRPPVGRDFLLAGFSSPTARPSPSAPSTSRAADGTATFRAEQIDAALLLVRGPRRRRVLCGDFNFDDGWDGAAGSTRRPTSRLARPRARR